MAATDQYTIRGALHPARAAARFIGGDVDDVITAAGAGVAREAAEDTNGTFTAWIMIPNTTETACTICAFGDTNADEFIDFAVKTGLLTCTISDGGVDQVTTQEDAIGLTPHKWHHVACVQTALGTGPKFYIDGVQTAATNDVSTDVDQWIGTELGGIDNFTIGMLSMNTSTTQEFKGYISDVKYWNRALSAEDILLDYQGSPQPNTTAKKDATYLQNHWDMKDDYKDNGLGADDGTVTGDVILCNAVSEFDSRLTFAAGIPVVADDICIALTDNIGFAYVVKAA